MKIAIDLNDVIRDYTAQFFSVYKKNINPSFELTIDEVTDFDLFNVFPFDDRRAYNFFKYEDCAFEIFGRANTTDRQLPSRFNLWVQNDMRNFEDEKVPELIIVSPFEGNLSIPSTESFLARIGSRVREVYFPIDSATIWDRCDILITANPNLIKNKPEGKTVIKILMPYNAGVEADYTYHTMMELMEDSTLKTLIEKE